MRRKLFTLCSALSLLLCVAIGVLWVRSYWVTDQLNINAHVRESSAGISYGQYGFGCYGGWLGLRLCPYLETMPAGRSYVTNPGEWVYERKRLSEFRNATPAWLVSRLWSFDLRRYGSGFRLMMPHWPLLAITATLPLLWLRRQYRQRRRHDESLCPDCGYDLRATRGRCPECGLVAESAGTAA